MNGRHDGEESRPSVGPGGPPCRIGRPRRDGVGVPVNWKTWCELAAWLAIVAGLAAVYWCAVSMPGRYAVCLGAALLVFVAVCLRHEWIRLLGPVFFYDLVRTARRRQFILLRCLYGVFLIIAFFFVYAIWAFDKSAPLRTIFSRAALDSRALADFASSFFLAFLAIQFLAACLLTPVFTAGAIPEDKACKTLEYLLATDLRSREIVLGVALSRLANLLLIIATGLPVLSLLELLGGVDPSLVLAGFAVTTLSMLSLTSLGILVSLYSHHPRQAVLRTYGWAAAYLISSGMSWLLIHPVLGWAAYPSTNSWTSPITVENCVEWINVGNPFAQGYLLNVAIGPVTSLDMVLPPALLWYAIFHGTVTALCGGWAILRFRVLILREAPGPVKNALPGTRWRWRPRAGRWPLLWKEMFTDSDLPLGRLGRIVLGVLVPISFLPALGILFDNLLYKNPGQGEIAWEYYNIWLRIAGTLVACVMLAGVASRAAGSISSERDRHTLDSLLATPSAAAAILFAKWLGSILGPRRGWIWLGLMGAVARMTYALDWRFIPAFILAWLIAAAFLASLGLWFSVISPTSQRAILRTLVVGTIFCFGHWLFMMVVLPVISGLTGSAAPTAWMSDFQTLGVTPPLTLAFLLFPDQELAGWRNADWEWAVVSMSRGACFWVLATAVFGSFAMMGFRRPSIKPLSVKPGEDPPAAPVKCLIQFGKRIVVRVAIVGGAVALFGVFWQITYPYSAAYRFQEAVAEADRLDPGWRIDELEAKRRVIPDAENAVLQVPLIPDESISWRPPRWYPGKQWPTKELEESLKDLQPEINLTKHQYRDLKANLDAVQPALLQARQLVHFPYGRNPIKYHKDGISTLLPWAQRNRTIANLLGFDAILRAHEGDIDGALSSCRAAINSGRAIGDEPFYVSRLIRMACRQTALERIERALAQGQASEPALASLQKVLEEDEPVPNFLIGTRGERASLDAFLAAVENGAVPYSRFCQYTEMNGTEKVYGIDQLMVFTGISARTQRAAILHLLNQTVEIAKLPVEDQFDQLGDIKAQLDYLPAISRSMFWPFDNALFFMEKQAEICRLRQALTRCMIVLVAVERYRLRYQEWPETLDALVPALLKHVPIDPYDKQSIRYCRRPDGVVIYVIGPDKVDNDGKFDRKQIINFGISPYANWHGIDFGFRLWDPARRRQPAKEIK